MNSNYVQIHVHDDELIVKPAAHGGVVVEVNGSFNSVAFYPESPEQLVPIAETIINNLSDSDQHDFLLRMCGGDVIEYFSIDVAEIARERASS